MNYYISHSAKGTTWKNHKYIAIKNGKYIYDTAKKKAKYGALYSKSWLKEKIQYKPYYGDHMAYPHTRGNHRDPNGATYSVDEYGPFGSSFGNVGSRLTPGTAEGRKRAGIKLRNGKEGSSSSSVHGEIAAQEKKEKIKKAVEKIKNALRKHGSKKVKDL